MKPIATDRLGKLSSAILSDVMDGLGLTARAMRAFIRPADDGSVLVGRARTGLFMPIYEVRDGSNPYEVEIALVEDLQPGEVCVLACNGPTERIAPWGELLTTAAIARGATGLVTDGLVRDVRQIRELGFPVFHGGIGPLDTKGRARMVERDIPVECAGVAVAPGDLVFGDIDGVVVVPQAREDEVLAQALAKAEAEDGTRAALAAGESLASVFRRFGVL